MLNKFPRIQDPKAVMIVCLLAAVLLLVYHQTVVTLVHTIYSSDSFSHAFLAPIVSIWLAFKIHQRGANLGELRLSTEGVSSGHAIFLGTLLILAGFGLAWFVAALAGVNAGMQFMLIGIIVSAFAAIFGLATLSKYAFPLAFLLFTVPFGEFLMDRMMIATADATVALLRLSGLAVFRDGLHFQLASGRWSVVEACSGLRYLLAALPLGALFAYLTYSTTKKRVLFMAACVAVPVIANWLRAYMIVMIGHYSGMTLAVGVDHLIYGWLFFGLVIGILFWVGGRYADPLPQPTIVSSDRLGESPSEATPVRVSGPTVSARLVLRLVLTLVLAGMWSPLFLIAQSKTPEVANLDAFEKMLVGEGAKPTLQFLPAFSVYQRRAEGVLAQAPQVDAFGAIFSKQFKNGEAVAWGNKLVPSEGTGWLEISAVPVSVSTKFGESAGPVTVTQSELRGINGATLLVWSWYVVGQKPLQATWQVKLSSILQFFQTGEDVAYFFSIATPVSNGATASSQAVLEIAFRELALRFDQFKPVFRKG